MTEFMYYRMDDVDHLNKLLKEGGWIPVREVSMKDAVLVLLQRNDHKPQVPLADAISSICRSQAKRG